MDRNRRTSYFRRHGYEYGSSPVPSSPSSPSSPADGLAPSSYLSQPSVSGSTRRHSYSHGNPNHEAPHSPDGSSLRSPARHSSEPRLPRSHPRRHSEARLSSGDQREERRHSSSYGHPAPPSSDQSRNRRPPGGSGRGGSAGFSSIPEVTVTPSLSPLFYYGVKSVCGCEKDVTVSDVGLTADQVMRRSPLVLEDRTSGEMLSEKNARRWRVICVSSATTGLEIHQASFTTLFAASDPSIFPDFGTEDPEDHPIFGNVDFWESTISPGSLGNALQWERNRRQKVYNNWRQTVNIGTSPRKKSGHTTPAATPPVPAKSKEEPLFADDEDDEFGFRDLKIARDCFDHLRQNAAAHGREVDVLSLRLTSFSEDATRRARITLGELVRSSIQAIESVADQFKSGWNVEDAQHRQELDEMTERLRGFAKSFQSACLPDRQGHSPSNEKAWAWREKQDVTPISGSVQLASEEYSVLVYRLADDLQTFSQGLVEQKWEDPQFLIDQLSNTARQLTNSTRILSDLSANVNQLSGIRMS